MRCPVDTGHTTAHLTMVTDALLTDLVKNFGRDTATAVWDAGRIAIDRIEESCRRPKPSTASFGACQGFCTRRVERDAGLSKDALSEQADACARDWASRRRSSLRLRRSVCTASRFEEQALFHPRKYLAGLAARHPRRRQSRLRAHRGRRCQRQAANGQSGGRTRSRAAMSCWPRTTRLWARRTSPARRCCKRKLALYTSYAIGGRLPAGHIRDRLVLGHRRPVSLPARRASAGTRFRHLWRRRSQDRASRRIRAPAMTDSRKRSGASRRSFELTDRWSGQVIETDRRPSVHWRNVASAVCRDGLWRQRHDLRDDCRHDGARCCPRPRQSLARDL